MTQKMTGARTACALVLVGLALCGNLLAQDNGDKLAAAKEQYAAAAYEQTLALLDLVRTTPAETITRADVEKYRAFCLLALGRRNEAEQAIERFMRLEPTVSIDDLNAAPSTKAAFRDVRRRILADIVTAGIGEAKASVLEKSYRKAAIQLRQVLSLLDDPDLSSTDARWRSDVRTLAQGFLNLADQVIASDLPAASGWEVRAEALEPPPSLTDWFLPPVAIDEDLPPWPSDAQDSAVEASEGVIEVVIDERGDVASATIKGSVHPLYDRLLLQAARNWKYRPATVGRVPVQYTRRLRILVTPR